MAEEEAARAFLDLQGPVVNYLHSLPAEMCLREQVWTETRTTESSCRLGLKRRGGVLRHSPPEVDPPAM